MSSPASSASPVDSYSALNGSPKSIKDFEIMADMGQGAYALVKAARYRSDLQKHVILKYVIKQRILVDCWTRHKELGTVPLEIHVLDYLRKHRHPNIVDMLDFFEDDDYYYIEMPSNDNGTDLFDYIENTPSMSEVEILRIFKQVVHAIQHLHKNSIVHRDIKDENVILDKSGTVRLIDFGSSSYFKENKKFDKFCGTLDYASPEVLKGSKYDGPPQDVWALGILLYTMIYKENPYYNIEEITDGDLRIPFVLSDGSLDLIKGMLDRDLDKRLTIDEVVKHEWLQTED